MRAEARFRSGRWISTIASTQHGPRTNRCGLLALTLHCYRSLNKAEDLCRRRRPVEAIPLLEKAMEDPRNLDAWVQLAFLAPDLDKSTNVLLNAEEQGKPMSTIVRRFGPVCG